MLQNPCQKAIKSDIKWVMFPKPQRIYPKLSHLRPKWSPAMQNNPATNQFLLPNRKKKKSQTPGTLLLGSNNKEKKILQIAFSSLTSVPDYISEPKNFCLSRASPIIGYLLSVDLKTDTIQVQFCTKLNQKQFQLLPHSMAQKSHFSLFPVLF